MGIPHGTSSGYSFHKCRCDECVAAKKARDRDYYQRNAEARKAKAAAYYAENRESARAQQAEYRAAHVEEIRAAKRRYYEENRDQILAYIKQWQKEHPEAVKASQARSRQMHREERRVASLANYYRRMAESPDEVRRLRREWAKTRKGVLANRAARSARRGAAYTPEAKAWIASLVDPVCAYCGELATEIDHVIPISRGGTGERSNLVPACRRCNARKGSQDSPVQAT